MVISVETNTPQATSSGNWAPMSGLAITLPRGAGDSALVILNVGAPWATGNNYPGGNFGLQVNGKVIAVYGSFTYSEPQPPNPGRMPTTVVAAVPLSQSQTTAVVAVWSAIRGSTVRIDSPATLSAII